MTELLSLPWVFYVVPCCAAVAAVFISRLLKISQFATLIGAYAPLGLPFTELPFAKQLGGGSPHFQVLGAWGALLAFALGWVALRALISGFIGRLGVLRLGYSALLFASVMIVGLLFTKPEVLDLYAPAWRGTAGGVLLGATLLGVLCAFVQTFRSMASLLVWSLVSVTLASQVFFFKMPYDLSRGDLKEIERLLPYAVTRGLLRSGMERFSTVGASAREILRSSAANDVES